MWNQFCQIADPHGDHRREDRGYRALTLEAICKDNKPRLRGVDCDGEPVIYDLGVRFTRASWQDALEYPELLLVCVEISCVANMRDSQERGVREGCHAMYGIGTDRGKLIIMNTHERLDLRAIDESWVRNHRCGQLMLVDIDLFLQRRPIRQQCLEEEEHERQALFYALAAPRSRLSDFFRQDDEDNFPLQEYEDKRARCAVQ